MHDNKGFSPMRQEHIDKVDELSTMIMSDSTPNYWDLFSNTAHAATVVYYEKTEGEI